jgi:hypothetical protein
MNKNVLRKILFFCAVLATAPIFSQPPPPPPPPCWPPPCSVPLNNGIVFLIVVGVLYGAYTLYTSKKKIFSK